jgi:hypothetical protein
MSEAAKFWKKLFEETAKSAGAIAEDERLYHSEDSFMRAFEKISENFESDFLLSGKRIGRLLAFNEYEGDKGRYISALKNYLAEWQTGDGPSIPAIIAAYYSGRGVDANLCANNPLVKASFMGALLAEIPVPATECSGYHEKPHFREVTLFNMISLSGEEHIKKTVYPLDIAAKQITIAVAHDLFHTGGDNSSESGYLTYYLEQRSFDAFRPYMLHCGLEERDMEDIHVGILVTDIMKGEDREYAAHQLLRQAYGFHFNNCSKPFLPDELELLLSEEEGLTDSRGKELTLMCIRMQESDIISSSLDPDSFNYRFMQLHAENPEKYPVPPTISGFTSFVGYVLQGGNGGETVYPVLMAPFYSGWLQGRIDRVYEEALRKIPEED